MKRMANASEDVVRRFYQAVADVDFDMAERCFAPDALWHLPGRSPIAGDHRGWAQIRDDFLSKLGPLSGGTFRRQLITVPARIARSARRLRLHLPTDWPWAADWLDLFNALHPPPALS